MFDRARVWNLLLSVASYVLFMIVLLGLGGAGMGSLEVTIWLVVLIAGIGRLFRRFRNARAIATVGSEVRAAVG